MTLQEIQELVRAGFTKSDIDRLTCENPAQETNPEPVPMPAEPAEVPQAPQEATTATEMPKAPGTELDRLFSELRNLTAAIQAGNRAAAEMGANIIDPKSAGMQAIAAIGGLPDSNK